MSLLGGEFDCARVNPLPRATKCGSIRPLAKPDNRVSGSNGIEYTACKVHLGQWVNSTGN